MLQRIAVVSCLLLCLRANAQPIIDHTNTDLGDLLDSALPAAAATTLHVRHASLGINISDGLDDLYAVNFKYDRSNWVFEYRGNPGWQEKIDEFTSFVAAHAGEYDVFGMKFCFVDLLAEWPYYRDALETLEAAYPGKVIVWWTMPVKAYPPASSAHLTTYQFNENVRAYCLSQGKTLFDLADIESHDPGGIRQVDADGNDVLYGGYTDDGSHLNAAGRVRVASALWHLMVSLSGGAPPGGEGEGEGPAPVCGAGTVSETVKDTIGDLLLMGLILATLLIGARKHWGFHE